MMAPRKVTRWAKKMGRKMDKMLEEKMDFPLALLKGKMRGKWLDTKTAASMGNL